MRHRRIFAVCILAALAGVALFFYGCNAMKASGPIVPVAEYEKMIAGRMDANYVGDSMCLSKCHAHDEIKKYFDASTMGAQLSAESGMPLVNCESCHGPGSLAVENIKEIEGEECCDYDTFIDLHELPTQAQSLICLKCHSANANFNLHDWNSGTHSLSGVSCIDCHDVHQGPDLKVHPIEVSDLCYKCHPYIRAEFSLPSHHSVAESRVSCLDCHSPHGSPGEKQLREATVKEVCTNCHAEKEGPFAFEHADITEDCTNCHRPHGSIHNNLLTQKLPFLCYQCHRQQGHHTLITIQDKLEYASCTSCHSEIHGTDSPGLFVPIGSFTR